MHPVESGLHLFSAVVCVSSEIFPEPSNTEKVSVGLLCL